MVDLGPDEHRRRFSGLAARDAERATTALVTGRARGRTTPDGSRRTFHRRWGSIKVDAGATAARSGLHYVERAEEHAKRAGELEASGGTVDREDLVDIVEAIDASVRVRRGPRAERLALTLILELPEEAPPAARKEIASAISLHMRRRYGLENRWGIHHHPQPHLHLLASARPVARVSNSSSAWWHVDREPSRRPDPDRHWRIAAAEELATLVNQVLDHHGIRGPRFDHRSFEELGIGRAARKRIPAWAYEAVQAAKAQGADPIMALVDLAKRRGYSQGTLGAAVWKAAWNREIDAGRDPRETLDFLRRSQEDWTAKRREERTSRRRAQEQARHERLERQGFVPTGAIEDAVCLAEAVAERTLIDERRRRAQAEARVQELLAASPAPSPDDAPATPRQMMVLFDMLEERGKFLTDPDAPITAAGAGELIRQLKALPVIRPEMPSSPSQAPQSGRKASGPSSLPPSPQRAPVPLESLLGEPLQDECVGYDVIVGDDRASSKAMLPSWDDAIDLASRALARGEPVHITADGIEERPLKLSVNVRGSFKEVVDQLSRIGTAAGVGPPHDLQVANGLIAGTWALVDQEQTASLRSQLVAAGYRSITPSTSPPGKSKPLRGLER